LSHIDFWRSNIARGLCAGDEVLLTATARNLERLAKLLCCAPPPLERPASYDLRIYKTRCSRRPLFPDSDQIADLAALRICAKGGCRRECRALVRLDGVPVVFAAARKLELPTVLPIRILQLWRAACPHI